MNNKKEEERNELHKTIWKIANDLRGSVDGWDFKQYILTILFYRFISENISNYVKQLDPNINYEEISDEKALIGKEDIIHVKGLFIKPSELFQNIVKNCRTDENLNETLTNIFLSIETSAKGMESEGDINGLFSDANFNSPKLGNTVRERNEKIVKILEAINAFNLGDYKNNTIDVFGDAYEFLMTMYAKNAGKSGGEFFTPQEVSELLAKITIIDFHDPNFKNKTEIDKVYDPACGSGSLLLKYAKILGKDNIKRGFFGQEINLTTFNLARINMFLHDINFDQFNIAYGNTLKDPKHLDEKPFEAIVSNPPYSIKWEGEDDPALANDERFNVTSFAPKSKADYAFVLHIIHHLAANGCAAVVEFPGILYRGNAEQRIREYLVKTLNCIDAVIQLPDNVFYGTSISTCILVLRKNKNNTNILFVDASKEFVKVDKNNKLSEQNIENILQALRDRKNVNDFSYLASIEEIESNNFNLSVNTYIKKEDTSEKIDIKVLNNQIEEIVRKNDFLRKEIDNLIKDLEVEDE